MPRVRPAPIATPRRNSPPPPRSLTLATNAVDQRDYRLALNHALESREHAQNAARMAAEAGNGSAPTWNDR